MSLRNNDNLETLPNRLLGGTAKLFSQQMEETKNTTEIDDLLTMQTKSNLESWKPIVSEDLHQKITSHFASSLEEEKYPVTITMTTCKRFDLFTKTVDSMLINCLDIVDYVRHWLVIDDNSSEEDREKMKKRYPFIIFLNKSPNEKGHARSMNIIWYQVKSPYIFHLEDDWLLFRPGRYIERCLRILQLKNIGTKRIGQVLLNRNYAEDPIMGNEIKGGFPCTKNGLHFRVHEHYIGESLHEACKKIPHSCFYWPHYSLRVGLTDVNILRSVGPYNESAGHFEMEFAQRWSVAGIVTVFLDDIVCSHTGRRTYERNDTDKTNAYELNQEKQFGIDKKSSVKNTEQKEQKEQKSERNEQNTRNTLEKIPTEKPPQNREYRKFSLHASVINLKRRPDRIETWILENHDKLDTWNRFDAIDGKILKKNHTIQKLFQGNDYNYRRGIVGCALSHICIWLQEGSRGTNALIIEDDAVLTNDFFLKFLTLLDNYPEADIIWLGHHPYPQYIREKDYNKDSYPIAEEWSISESIIRSMGGTTAYYVTATGMLKLLNHINEQGVKMGIDWVMQRTPNLRMFYSSPFLAFADSWQAGNKDTDIQTEHDSVGWTDEEWFAEELKRWGARTLDVYNDQQEKNYLQSIGFSIGERTSNSSVVWVPEISLEKSWLHEKAIIFCRDNKSNRKRLQQLPTIFYSIGNKNKVLVCCPEWDERAPMRLQDRYLTKDEIINLCSSFGFEVNK